jgi:hypothetical protein
MNSDNIYRLLNRMLNDQLMPHRHRRDLQTVVQHIRHQDREISELKEDITDVNLPSEENENENAR